jgi:hypothetical protein
MSDSYILEQSYFGKLFFPNNYWTGEFVRTPTKYLVKALAGITVDALPSSSIRVKRTVIEAEANYTVKVKRSIIKAG